MMPLQVAAGNAGWPFQFRIAVHDLWSRVPELWTLGDSPSMRIFSYILMAVGLLMLTAAGYDEYHGVTRIQVGRSLPEVVIKTSSPEDFHNAMTYHWFYASMVVVAGIITNMIDRGQEKSDPLSPDFAGNKELDD